MSVSLQFPSSNTLPSSAPTRHCASRCSRKPQLVGPYLTFMAALRDQGWLLARLIELLRLRVAFHNHCRSCLAIRYSSALDVVTQNLICSLEKAQEADDLIAAEKAALAYADKMATDHL
jgi:alkylhydroperoxidase family enzyme